jgi:hypothetical protein
VRDGGRPEPALTSDQHGRARDWRKTLAASALTSTESDYGPRPGWIERAIHELLAASPDRAFLAADRGATSVRRQRVRRRNHPTRSAVTKVRMG